MNDITNISDFEPTMSSREIANLVESRHDSVRRTVERLAEKQVIQLPPLVEVTNHLGQTVCEYRICKRDSYVVVAQLSPEFTARLVDRWQELEAQQPRFDPAAALNDPATMRSLLLGYSEKVIALEHVNAELTPKAEALDRIATARGSLCITDAAKALQIPPRTLFDYLQRKRWIFRRHGTGWLGYSDKSREGLVEHKCHTIDRADGSNIISEQVRITPKGLAKLAEAFNYEEIAA